MLGLLLADRAGGLPFSMPRSWYIDRALWVAGGLALFAAGWRLLRDLDEPGAEPTDQRPPVRFERVIVYTRAGCHLCNTACETLARYSQFLPAPTLIDIDADPALCERFNTCVPVVEIDGRVRFRGIVNEVLLRRLIAARGGSRGSTP